jgi:hypothetical protein
LLIIAADLLPSFKILHPLVRRVAAQSCNPTVCGVWGQGFSTDPYNQDALMVQTTLLPTGNVLFWKANYDGTTIAKAYVWNPGTPGSFTNIDPPAHGTEPNNIFCAGHVVLPGGRVLIMGGQTHMGVPFGLSYTNIFDSSAGTLGAWWTWDASTPQKTLQDMSYGRWYPTSTVLADGSVLVQSGKDPNGNFVNTPERWIPNGSGGGGWTALTGIPQSDNVDVYYPWVYVDERLGHEGQVFVAGPDFYSDDIDAVHNNPYNGLPGYWLGQVLDHVSPPAGYGSVREYGSSVLYGPGRILVAGGESSAISAVPTPTAEVISLLDQNPSWRTTNSMNHARRHMNATVLPDGKVLVTGGTTANCANETDESNAVLEGELWDPISEQRSSAGTMQEARLYHSIALLLPDATVLIAGGGQGGSCGSPAQNFNTHTTAQIYSPPYLQQPGTRPVIGGLLNSYGANEFHYGQSLWFWLYGDPNGVGNSDTIKQVSLVRLPSVTHCFNQNQWFRTYLNTNDPRYSLYLDPNDNDPNAAIIYRHWTNTNDLARQLPSRPEELPPGHYMLFAINTAGVPSVATIVRITDPNNSWDQQ